MWVSGDFDTSFFVGFCFVLFCFSLHPSTGCILGVGLVLSLMSHSSRMESRVHVAASLRKLSTYLDDSGSQSRTFQEVGAGSDGFLCFLCSCCCLFSTSHVLVTLKLNSSSVSGQDKEKNLSGKQPMLDHKVSNCAAV